MARETGLPENPVAIGLMSGIPLEGIDAARGTSTPRIRGLLPILRFAGWPVRRPVFPIRPAAPVQRPVAGCLRKILNVFVINYFQVIYR